MFLYNIGVTYLYTRRNYSLDVIRPLPNIAFINRNIMLHKCDRFVIRFDV